MKSKWLVEQRLVNEDDPKVIEVLKWVLLSPECPMCNHPLRREIEVSIFNGTYTVSYIEAKNSWRVGVVQEHMDDHLEFDPSEAQHIEVLREDTITTLDMAEMVFSRITRWLDEWEAKKEEEGGISKEWIGEATKLVATANTNLKLIGTLKKEIGVDSQLLLAQQQVNGIMGVIVDVLREQPQLLNQMELRLAAMRGPTTIEADFEVIE